MGLKGKKMKVKEKVKVKKIMYNIFAFTSTFTCAVKSFLLILCGIFLLISVSTAEDISFETTVDRNVAQVGSGIQLNMSFNGITNINAPNLPGIPNFRSRYIGPSTLMSMINGKVTNSVTHAYLLIPEKTGNLTIPSLSIEYNGKAYSSKPIPIKVVSSSSSQAQDSDRGRNVQGSAAPIRGAADRGRNVQGSAAPIRGAADQERNVRGSDESSANGQNSDEMLDDKLFLTMKLSKDSAYVNEKIRADIKLYISNLSVRDIMFPLIENDAFLVDKFFQPKQYREVLNGISYNIIDFSTNIYGLYPGEFRLKPTELNCNIIIRAGATNRRGSHPFDDSFFNSNIFGNFFGQYEKHPTVVKSISVPINILPLPESGRPTSFDGALGNFNFTVGISPKDVQVGDPITLTMEVSGTGNMNTVISPKLNIAGSFKTYEPEISQDSRIKTFKQVVVPKNDKITQIPPISFSFFNTNTKTYKTITTGPVPIKVRPLEKGQELKIFEMSKDSADRIKRVETLGRDIVYLKNNPGAIYQKDGLLCKNEALLILLFLPALAVILVLITQARKDYLALDVRYARKLAAPRKAKKNLANVRALLNAKETGKFYDAVFKTLQEYIGDKFHLSTAGITSDVIDEIKTRGVSAKILDELKACFDMCDKSRYAPSSIQHEEACNTLKTLEGIIDKMEKVKT